MTTTKTHSEEKKPSYYGNWAVFDNSNKQHKYILSLCIQLGWSQEHERYGEVADLTRLSNWLKSDKCPVKKPLKTMTPEEVSTVISALMIINKKEYEK